MFKVTKIGTNRLNIELNGKLNTDEMKIALDELTEKAKDIIDGTLLYTVIDFHLPTLGAILHEFSRLPSMLSLIRNFSRAAVLTDKIWLQTASEIEGSLLPGIEIKAFSLDQRPAAETWLSN